VEKIQNRIIECAKEILRNNPDGKTFNSLWIEIIKKLNLSKEEANAQIAELHTTLLLSKEFVMLHNNVWSLRSLWGHDEVKVAVSSAYDEHFKDGHNFIEDEEEDSIDFSENTETDLNINPINNIINDQPILDIIEDDTSSNQTINPDEDVELNKKDKRGL